MPELTTRPFRAGDEAAILDLFARSFPHAPRSHAHFRWKYQENPFGNERISLTFDHESRLVGHYSAYLVPFRKGSEDFLAHQIGDTMTDVSVRHIGRGPTSVLGRTALHFYEHFCQGHVAFNFGFNVANIQKFSLRFLRSDRVEPVSYRARDLRTKPFAPLSRTERWLRGYRFELVSDVGQEFDELFERVANEYRFCVARTAAWIRWRYLACPDVRYFVVAIRRRGTLRGWIAYRIRENRLSWGDAFLDPRDSQALPLLLRHLAHTHAVNIVEGWFPSRPRWHGDLLRTVELELRPEPQDLSVMCVPFQRPSVVDEMRDELFYTWGDGDLF
jgi:hypothetical protein